MVLVADMYGKGVRPKDDAEAMAQVKQLYADRSVLRAARQQGAGGSEGASGQGAAGSTRLGAIGFCFGGATVLELARSGADIAGVVSFHGGLATSMPAQRGAVKASLLVLNGADDATRRRRDIAGFKKEMDAAGVDWQFVDFSGAVHCFALRGRQLTA